MVLNLSGWQQSVSRLKFPGFSWPVAWSCHTSCYALSGKSEMKSCHRIGIRFSRIHLHFYQVLTKKYWGNSCIIYVCLCGEWFSQYICVRESKWLMETEQSLYKEETRLGKKAAKEIIRLKVDMINVHKIMKVMGKMNTELLFPYPAMFELQCIDETIRSLV